MLELQPTLTHPGSTLAEAVSGTPALKTQPGPRRVQILHGMGGCDAPTMAFRSFPPFNMKSWTSVPLSTNP